MKSLVSYRAAILVSDHLSAYKLCYDICSFLVVHDDFFIKNQDYQDNRDIPYIIFI